MTAVTQAQDSYLEAFARFEPRAGGDGRAWLGPTRRGAMDRFAQLGFPTTRDEDWRFTSVAPIANTPFRLPEARPHGLAARALEPFLFGAGTRLAFVDGRYAPDLSSLGPLPGGVQVGSLAEALAAHRDLVEPHLARYAEYHQDAFTALNTAFLEDGGFVHVPRGAVVEEPIHLLYVATQAGASTMTHPRNLVLAGDHSQATIVEDYAALTEAAYLSNAVTELVTGQDSVLSHYLIERESVQAFNVSTLRIQQGRSSSVASHSVLLGGALVRNNIHPVLAGEGGECLINGLFMPAGTQHMDNYMKVEHASAHCDSRQFYHGILDGHARGVFHGRIVVHKDAQKTDAKQTNRNLLLSQDAQVDTKPQLEIYADDVKCTHGATIGQVDEDAIFYLRARGIPEASARAMLLFAFAGESLERMKAEPVRQHLEGLVTQWLSRGRVPEGIR